MKINESHKNIAAPSAIRGQKSDASLRYGERKRADSITLQRIIAEARLTELLNSLENIVDDLNFKSFTAYDTLNTAIEAARAVLSHTTDQEAGTDTATCTRCEEKVNPTTLTSYSNWELCEVCVSDI